MFLPWSEYFSLDSILNPNLSRRKVLSSAATAAYTFQIIFIYFFASMQKTSPEWRSEGSAVFYALSIEQFATPFGHFLLNFPPLLKILTFATLGLEQFGSLILLISPLLSPILRLLMVLGFMGMEGSFLLTMSIGIFPWVCMAALLGLLPSIFWDQIAIKLKIKQGKALKLYYDGECGTCQSVVHLAKTLFFLSDEQLIPAQQDESILKDMNSQNSWVGVSSTGRRYFRFEVIKLLCGGILIYYPLKLLVSIPLVQSIGNQVYTNLAKHRLRACKIPSSKQPVNLHRFSKALSFLVILIIVYEFFWNLSGMPGTKIALPYQLQTPGLVLRLDQYWNMFAPFPYRDDGWYVVPGTLVSGQTIDLFSGSSSVSFQKPALISAMYKNDRWRKYMLNLWLQDYSAYRPLYTQYLCSSWNDSHSGSQKLETIQLIYMLHSTHSNLPPQKVELLDYACSTNS